MRFEAAWVLVLGLAGAAGCNSDDWNPPNLREGMYEVRSDVPGAKQASGREKLKKKSIFNTTPADYDLGNAQAYGMPTNLLNHYGPHKVVSTVGSGDCVASVFKQDAPTALFVCRDGTGALQGTLQLVWDAELTP